MTSETFDKTIRQRIEAMELVVDVITREGRESDLHDLRVLLINIMGLLKRDPGIESAADDLYAAATALVKDHVANVPPAARRLRFLNASRERLRQRLPVVVEQGRAAEPVRYDGLAAAYAIQVSRGVTRGETALFPDALSLR